MVLAKALFAIGDRNIVPADPVGRAAAVPGPNTKSESAHSAL